MKATKEKTYDKTKIETCRNCHGSGRVKSKLAFIKYRSDCPICNGYGQIEKITDIKITIKPYNNKEHHDNSN